MRSTETRHALRSGTKVTKHTKTTKCFVVFEIFVALVPEREVTRAR